MSEKRGGRGGGPALAARRAHRRRTSRARGSPVRDQAILESICLQSRPPARWRAERGAAGAFRGRAFRWEGQKGRKAPSLPPKNPKSGASSTRPENRRRSRRLSTISVLSSASKGREKRRSRARSIQKGEPRLTLLAPPPPKNRWERAAARARLAKTNVRLTDRRRGVGRSLELKSSHTPRGFGELAQAGQEVSSFFCAFRSACVVSRGKSPPPSTAAFFGGGGNRSSPYTHANTNKQLSNVLEKPPANSDKQHRRVAAAQSAFRSSAA